MVRAFFSKCCCKNDIVLFLFTLQAFQIILLQTTTVLQPASAFTFHAAPHASSMTRDVLEKGLFHPRIPSSLSLPQYFTSRPNLNHSQIKSNTQMHMAKYQDQAHNGEIQEILKQCNFDKRLITIHKSELPVVGELYASGSWKLCIITGFKAPNSLKDVSAVSLSSKEEIISPLLEVLVIDPDPHCDYTDDSVLMDMRSVVDIGQITTIWKYPVQDDIKGYAKFLSDTLHRAEASLGQDFLSTDGETIMQSLYESKTQNVGGNQRGGSKPKPLTKKDIGRIASSVGAGSGDDNYQSHVQQILRKAVKAGLGDENSCLVDSLTVATALFKGKVLGKDQSKTEILLSGASLLAMDADLGGRFKRSPCIYVSTNYKVIDGNPAVSAEGVVLINGGWAAVDDSVRAGAEARKFAERSIANAAASASDSANNEKQNVAPTFTAADERIMYRLECLAMGEELGNGDEKELELDVRETLSAMSLEKSPKGAQEALVKVGRWSPLQRDEIEAGRKGIRQMYSPWSSDILSCAKALRDAEEERRLQLYKLCSKNKSGKAQVDKRKDLTDLPAVCIDAKRASFRDDAIGVRPRSSTGRKVKKDCKWELLIHIADISDIYSPAIQETGVGLDLAPLRRAAESRGTSRYDLPLGPLHLMPPVALEALALDTQRSSRQSSVNRCVTLWVYIDEKTGKIIDAGLERTIIRKPLALAFEEATQVFTSDEDVLSASAKQSKPLLIIIDKILSRWKGSRLQSNEAARKREKRLQTREMVAKEMQLAKSMRDDGAGGSFQRSRGHKIVDNALDLHGSTLSSLLVKVKAPIPRASGSGMDRGGRLGTAPLRRYIDGVAQRQALSVLCNYGGPPMTREECSDANEIATKAINKINNLKSTKNGTKDLMDRNDNALQRKKALQALARQFASKNGNNRIVPALSTGKNNEVVLSGHGILVKCNGIKGTLKSGERILVGVTQLDTRKGLIKVAIVDRK